MSYRSQNVCGNGLIYQDYNDGTYQYKQVMLKSVDCIYGLHGKKSFFFEFYSDQKYE